MSELPALPDCTFLALRHEGWRLHVTLNRPKVRNAMNFAMVREMIALFEALEDRRDIRAVILRGAGGHFCAGGDIKDMASVRHAEFDASQGEPDPMAVTNRLFGHAAHTINRAPQAVIAVLEGAVMGGGFGLACVSDVAIAARTASFRLPETSLGVPPAQIAPFVVQRLGLTQARRLAVTGGRFDGEAALALGLVHFVCDADELDAQLQQVLKDIHKCAPAAIATTKRLMLDVGAVPLPALLDRASVEFAGAVRGGEGIEGMVAFLEKRPPRWAAE
ncbi:MAG: enoyl-CoA hydratase/isomerase family protein [Myxococcales bacterium]|nr:enoyl-CoA hydratase/isomerase family protein [Myxococcales bacterium]MCB9755193.1 enoyl-CoA hydratase/isomerase family protein [Myxococcales bacterium]